MGPRIERRLSHVDFLPLPFPFPASKASSSTLLDLLEYVWITYMNRVARAHFSDIPSIEFAHIVYVRCFVVC